jgi:hypothetical protein
VSERIRYLCIARLGGSARVFCWDSGGDAADAVVLGDAGVIQTFGSEADARQAAHAAMSPEAPAHYDLDALEAWCKSTDTVHSCSELLDAWNLFGDLPRAESVFAKADSGATPLYDKLFHGCNLPAMTEPGEHYTPTWSASELAQLKRALLLGLAEFRARWR